MKRTIFTVHAYKHGDRQRHSYIVGVYSNKKLALTKAEIEEDTRRGTYNCEVLRWKINKGGYVNSKIIKGLQRGVEE